MHLAEIISD